MSLDPLHEQIARIAFTLPEAGQVALAGGGAMRCWPTIWWIDQPRMWICSRPTPLR